MPNYLFRCEDCDKDFYKICKFNEDVSCDCGGNAVRVFGSPAVHFKGRNFYCNKGD